MEGQEEERERGNVFFCVVKDHPIELTALFVLIWFLSLFLPFYTQGSGESKNEDEDDEDEVLDEETLRRDQVVKGAIEVLIREYASELNAPSQDPDSQPRNKKRKEKKEEVVFA